MKELSDVLLIPLCMFLFFAFLEINHLKKEVRRLDEKVFQQKLEQIRGRK